jgi:hypothetical protein
MKRRAVVGVVLSWVVLMTGASRADWMPLNGGDPVDTGQDVNFKGMAPFQPMATMRMPRRASDPAGPDDLMYVFKTGLNTVAGRLRGQVAAGGGPTWQILAMDNNDWSSSSDVLPSVLNNAVWCDLQMILAHDPNDPQGTFFVTASSHLMFGAAGTDEHGSIYGGNSVGRRGCSESRFGRPATGKGVVSPVGIGYHEL